MKKIAVNLLSYFGTGDAIAKLVTWIDVAPLFDFSRE